MLLWSGQAPDYLLSGGEKSTTPTHIVTLLTSPPVEFYKQDAAIPHLSGLHYRRLSGFEPFRRPCGGSIGSSENSNGGIRFDNSDGFLSRLWSIPPLRARIRHEIVLSGVRQTLFEGTVAQVTLSSTVTLALEA